MTEKKRIVFVVNPISGTQGKKAILKWIDERLDQSIYDYSIVKTEYAGHATQIAANAVQEKVDVVGQLRFRKHRGCRGAGLSSQSRS